jgi:hypothetical protein
MMVLEDLMHWQEQIMGEMDWLKKELEKDDITSEKKTEFEDRMKELQEEAKGPQAKELRDA